MPPPELNKVRSVIAFFAEHLNPRPGKVQLYKLMFLADFSAHAKRGGSISRETYFNYPMGPVPRRLHDDFFNVTKACVEVRRVKVGKMQTTKYEMHPAETKWPWKDHLESDDEEILKNVCDDFGRMSTGQLIRLTHRSIPYRATDRSEKIRFGLARYLGYAPVTKNEAREIVELYGDDIKSALADAENDQVGA